MHRIKDASLIPAALKHRLERGPVSICFDATHENCKVPLEHKTNTELVLNLSYKFAGHKMHFGLDALHASLTFRGAEFRCVIPWAAIYYIAPVAPIGCSPEPEPEKPAAEEAKPSFLRVVK